ncbi:putative ribonuclease H-like domain-containing protein [Tanacetum coccineum]
MHTRASNYELIEPLPEPECTLNRRLRRRNRRVPYDQRNNPPQNLRIVYPPILNINYFRHFLDILRDYDPMDDELMWAADRVVALTPGFTITIPETEMNLLLKEMLRNRHGHNLSKGNIIKIVYHGLSEITQEVLNAAASEDMEFESTNSGTTAKLPILKLGMRNSAQSTQRSQNGGEVRRRQSLSAMEREYTEDLNLKFLSSLAPEWNTHVVVWMNKPEVDTMSIDDLYNNFKIVEQKVKKSVGGSSVSTVSLNVNTASPQVSTASLSDNVVYAFMVENPNGSDLLHQDLEQIHEDDLEAIDLKWQLSLLNMREKRYYQRTGNKIFINSNDIARKQGNNEDTYSKAMLAIDGVGFDWSDMAEEQKQYDDLIVKLNQTEFTATTYKRGLATLDEQLITYRKNEVLFSEEVVVLKREVACKDYEINVLKSEFEKVKQEKEGIEFKIEKFDKASKDLDQLLGSQITDKSKKGLGYSVIPPPHPLIYNRPNKLDLSYFYDSKKSSDDSLVKEQVLKDTSNFVESSLNVDKETIFPVDKRLSANTIKWNGWNMVPRAVLMKSGLKTFNTARTVNTAHPKSTVFSAKPILHFSKPAQSTVRRPFQTKTSLYNKRFTQAVNTAKAQVVNTARPKVVKTTRPNSAVVNAVRGKPQQDDTGFVDSGCLRHVTGNIAYLSDFKEFDGGYVAFGGGAHGGRITGKGTLKTDNLDFEDVYFVNDFKLPDENQILLKIPRKDNMYGFDMKNIVPKESLTCLVAKATSDESMLWHRRLDFIKEIENLVDKKVKIIRSDNGTKFKNKVMDDFCREKCIKREYSVARTPQQNGIAERRNRTLIEVAKPKLADFKLPTTFC